MNRTMAALAIVAVASGQAACASKKYVNTRVSEVNDKVSTLSTTVEETQERTRKNEQRIGEVDQKAAAAATRADEAGRSATEARSAATAAATRAEEVDKATRKLIFEVVLADDKSRFEFGKATLSDEAKAEVDRVVAQVQADPKNVYLEIEGHTDSVGATATNERLGLERAEAVKQYLYEQHQIPLHKMNVISYGEERPVAPNETREGRAQNRRVVIRVLG
jgi:outer membrane protein OmpA-like peptidoglycan-associated protein